MLELSAFDIFHYLAIPENSFQGDELPFLESFGEFREIAFYQSAQMYQLPSICLLTGCLGQHRLVGVVGCKVLGLQKTA